MTSARQFVLFRDEDETGISGTGEVAEGIQFSNGKVVLCWISEHSSITIWDELEFVNIVHGHGGKTRVVWADSGNHCRACGKLFRSFCNDCAEIP
jgi:hypothetical protein